MFRKIANFIHILDIITPYNASIETRKSVRCGKYVIPTSKGGLEYV